ncbi:MAG TPA: MBL fold metallo-hydrolase [Spirochaetota bacterium]|nr:MBL fold metallo-hydrolase [Spirochaetota bacterium]
MIIEQILVGQMAVFCYLVGNPESGEAVLIDPASEFDKINAFIDRYGLRITRIINSHGHFDHTSGNSYFSRMTGAELCIHENDSIYLHKKINRLAAFIKGGRAVKQNIRLLKDGDMINVGTRRIEVIHTPGHTRGSICLLCEGNLFTGDTLFTEGMGRADFADGSEKQIMESIKNRILTLPDDTKIWPGHHYGRFPVTTVREQKRYYGL